MPDSIAVSYDADKIGVQPAFATRQAHLDFFNSLSIAVGVDEGDVGVITVQGALASVAASVSESELSITALDDAGNTTAYTVPTKDYADSLKTNVEELQTLYAALKVSLAAAGVTV